MAGHVRRRGDKWQARYPDPYHGGTRKFEKTFRTKREADEWLTKQQSSVLDGSHIDPRRLDTPFRELVETWKATWIDLSPTTMSGYQSTLDTHLLPAFGDRKVGTITHEVIQRYVSDLVKRGEMRPGTIRQIFSVLRNAMSTGIRTGIIKTNPCAKIRLPPQPREEMLFITVDEVRALAEAITPRYRTLVYVAAYTGMRASEIHALRRRDIDLTNGQIHIRRTFRWVNGKLHIGTTKTASSRRIITIPSFLRVMLAEHLLDMDSGGDPSLDDLVFTTKRGNPIRHNLFYHRHYKKAVRASMPPEKQKLRFHDLRHTCASLLIAQGVHAKTISKTLGHSSIQITFDRYGHVFPSVEDAMADALDAAFASGTDQPPMDTANA